MLTNEMRKYVSGNPYFGEKTELSSQNREEVLKLINKKSNLKISPEVRALLAGNPYIF